MTPNVGFFQKPVSQYDEPRRPLWLRQLRAHMMIALCLGTVAFLLYLGISALRPPELTCKNDPIAARAAFHKNPERYARFDRDHDDKACE